MVLDAQALAALLKTLPPLQEKVVRLFYGFACRRSHSACEIAGEFEVSPQVIGGVLGVDKAARREHHTIALRRLRCRRRS
jgi:DNA-directed RNA polymerase sigma subunit (sigma70/sigma32)